jgi:hypothetical protein
MPKFVQLIPVVKDEAFMPTAFFGLEDDGHVWYGLAEWKETQGAQDAGPDAIKWRRVD